MWYGSLMFGMRRRMSPVFGSRNTRSLLAALATMSSLSSAAIMRWCGSLPTGTRLSSFIVIGSTIEMLPSPELRTITFSPGVNTASAVPAPIAAAARMVFPRNFIGL